MNFLPLWPAKVRQALEPLQGTGLLALRLWVGLEFGLAGWTKLAAGVHAPAWFAGLAFPFPVSLLPADLNWVLAAVAEVGLSAALVLGLWSRLAALGLMAVTWVAIYSVHFELGWAGWNQIETEAGQGFKVPLMLLVMLWALATQGAGRYALGAWWCRARARTRAAQGVAAHG